MATGVIAWYVLDTAGSCASTTMAWRSMPIAEVVQVLQVLQRQPPSGERHVHDVHGIDTRATSPRSRASQIATKRHSSKGQGVRGEESGVGFLVQTKAMACSTSIPSKSGSLSRPVRRHSSRCCPRSRPVAAKGSAHECRPVLARRSLGALVLRARAPGAADTRCAAQPCCGAAVFPVEPPMPSFAVAPC